ncbi:MAG: 4'-phosphopantetheinyl transferase superfamily protein [Spongiibacteraceae bacterium]
MIDAKASRTLVPGQVDLWFCATSAVGVDAAIGASRAKALARCEVFLDEEELAHSRRLRFPQHQREYILSHALLRTTLSHYADVAPTQWSFLRNAFGKPYLIETIGAERLRFNLSHTHGLSVCAVALDVDLGVDVEFHANRESLLEVADHYFSPREIADLRALPKAIQGDVFFRYWTLKESYIKARGEGLSIPLDSFSFHFPADAAVEFIDHTNTNAVNAWQFQWMEPSPLHSAAVAIKGARLDTKLFWSTIDTVELLSDVAALTARMRPFATA